MKKFKELGLSPELLKILKAIGFNEPTDIQEKVIPIAMSGKDVIGESATGSGKTLAFGAPILEKVEPGKGIQALVLTPTRELAMQVSQALSIFSNHHLKILPVYGGVSLEPQMDHLRTADIVVGTPGRILDHLSRRTIDLSKVRFLVLDEADRMLDMGFLYDVTKIIDHCPKHNRQTFLFSATISAEIMKISKKYMNDAIKISLNNYIDPSKLEHIYYEVPSNEKFSLLVHLLKEEKSKLVMVFCNTKRNTDVIGRNLSKQGFEAIALHGDLSQNQRSRVLEDFHKGRKFILVCTDVAARGLDIKDVSHIYNYDSPKTSIEYIHRVGRTARAGKEGKAITVLGERDYDNFRRVLNDEALIIKKTPTPQFEKVFVQVNRQDSFRRGSHGGFGQRRSFSRGRDFGHRPRYPNDRPERSSYGRRNFEPRENRESYYARPENRDKNREEKSERCGFNSRYKKVWRRSRNFHGRRFSR